MSVAAVVTLAAIIMVAVAAAAHEWWVRTAHGHMGEAAATSTCSRLSFRRSLPAASIASVPDLQHDARLNLATSTVDAVLNAIAVRAFGPLIGAQLSARPPGHRQGILLGSHEAATS